MPITESFEGNGCRIECWTISESTAELENLCNVNGIATANTFALESRYQQHMATQLLFNHLFGAGEGLLQYHSTGKPYVYGSELHHVSISHSGVRVTMMKSGHACGVDIERIHPRVEKVKHKFLNDDELVAVNGAPTFTVVQYWTAKEAMFKVYGSQEVFMRNNIVVSAVNGDEACAELKDRDLTLKRRIVFRVVDDMLLAWTEPYETE
jgi:phosphopantetheinyl transferase